MIARRLQFDSVVAGVFHPNQLGGIIQRSTEDAEEQLRSEGVHLLSYVDDGTIIVQSPSLDNNIPRLKDAYWKVVSVLEATGLVLEHEKSEVFHFSRSHNETFPSLILSDTVSLVPKTHWCYLGFYFDAKLSFKEHVRYYSTKSISTVKAMGMLGNSSRGLLPLQKRLLYRSCVVPIATYGYCLWFYKGAKIKCLLADLKTMQRRAALWVLGAFRTSPTVAIEALAGLIPIHLHLTKLAQRSQSRLRTLHPNHALHSLSGMFPHRPQIGPSALRLSDVQRAKAKGAFLDSVMCSPHVSEELVSLPPDLRPGDRITDLFHSRFSFNSFD